MSENIEEVITFIDEVLSAERMPVKAKFALSQSKRAIAYLQDQIDCMKNYLNCKTGQIRLADSDRSCFYQTCPCRDWELRRGKQ